MVLPNGKLLRENVEVIDIAHDTVVSIWKEHLSTRKSSWWVKRLLTISRNWPQEHSCINFSFKCNPDYILRISITAYGTWAHRNIPETQQQFKVWDFRMSRLSWKRKNYLWRISCKLIEMAQKWYKETTTMKKVLFHQDNMKVHTNKVVFSKFNGLCPWTAPSSTITQGFFSQLLFLASKSEEIARRAKNLLLRWNHRLNLFDNCF